MCSGILNKCLADQNRCLDRNKQVFSFHLNKCLGMPKQFKSKRECRLEMCYKIVFRICLESKHFRFRMHVLSMLLKVVSCNNHVTNCTNKDLLLIVVLFLTEYWQCCAHEQSIVAQEHHVTFTYYIYHYGLIVFC